MTKTGREIIDTLDFWALLDIENVSDEEKFVIKDQLEKILKKIKGSKK